MSGVSGASGVCSRSGAARTGAAGRTGGQPRRANAKGSQLLRKSGRTESPEGSCRLLEEEGHEDSRPPPSCPKGADRLRSPVESERSPEDEQRGRHGAAAHLGVEMDLEWD